MKSTTSTLVAGLTLAAFAHGLPVAAQDPGPPPTDPVLWACYQPKSGIVYRVNAPDDPGGDPDLKDACSGAEHVLFSWSDAQGADHGDLSGLDDDDHGQYLLTGGVRASRGFAVTGELGVGSIPVEGGGVRLMWHPAKAAFRAGTASDEWDDVHVGQGSLAAGFRTTASGLRSVALGTSTVASSDNSLAVGTETVASGLASAAFGLFTTASGVGSMVGGIRARAEGDRSLAFGTDVFALAGAVSSVALGSNALTYHPGSFVFGDAASGADRIETVGPNQFVVRASNGVRFFSSPDLSSAVLLTPGSGAWASLSDRNAKENIRPEDPEAVLRAVAEIPVSSWNYKAQDASIRHVGPMAQDFHTAFGLGEGDTTINTVDIDGINMLAIQALERRTREIGRLEVRLRETESRLLQLEAARQALQAQLGPGSR